MSILSHGRGGGTIKDPNVTPLVDVMMVLLVVFMIMAPMMVRAMKHRREVGVDLPRTDSQQAPPEQSQKMVLTITQDLRFLIDEDLIADCGPEAGREYLLEEGGCMTTLEEKLVGNVKLQKDKEIYLLADRRIPYGVVVSAMARIKKAGVERLGMVTDPPGGLGDSGESTEAPGPAPPP